MKYEFEINETFQCGLIKLKVQKADEDFPCKGCYFFETSKACGKIKDIIGECEEGAREDSTHVIFKKVEE